MTIQSTSIEGMVHFFVIKSWISVSITSRPDKITVVYGEGLLGICMHGKAEA
jgi:hypothetical protein